MGRTNVLPQRLSIVDDLEVATGGQSPPQRPGQQRATSVALQEVAKQHPQHIHKTTAVTSCLRGLGNLHGGGDEGGGGGMRGGGGVNLSMFFRKIQFVF